MELTFGDFSTMGTDRRTNRRMDKASYRDARMHLKKNRFFLNLIFLSPNLISILPTHVLERSRLIEKKF